VGRRVSSPEFIGRGDALQVLDAALAAALDTRAATVLIEGEAGIGKTRLVEEFCARARQRGARTARGVCVPVTDGGLPYGPAAGILRELTRDLGERAAELLGPLADGLPAISGRAISKVSHQHKRVADDLAKTELFESVLTAFTGLADDAPLVLVFDDLQWADSASAELLSFLSRNLVQARTLLVGTIRSDEVGPDHELRAWLAELTRHHLVTQLQLERLNHEELIALIASILGRQPHWALAEAVWARSQGNPFFAEELTAAGPVTSLPPELARVIMTRVEGLSKKAQQLLRIAAVVGLVVDHRLLATVADSFDIASLDSALAEVVASQVLTLDDSGDGYRFRHALMREAVAASLLPGERLRLHRRVAEALTADATGPSVASIQRAAELAAHWWAAAAWTEAYACSIEAADAAFGLWAFPEALVHLERALAACDRMASAERPPAEDRLRLLDRAADVAYLAGASARAVELGRAVLDETDVDADPAGAARRYAVLGRNCWGLSDSDAALDAYRRAVSVMPADPPTTELAHVLAEEARGLMLQSRWRDAEQVVRRAIGVARTTGGRAEESHAVNTLGCCLAGLGHYDEGIDLMYHALAIAEEIGSPEHVDRAEVNLGMLFCDSGRLDEAAALVDDRLPAVDEHGVCLLNGVAAMSAEALIRLGRYDEADRLLATINEHDVGICVSSPQLVPLPLELRRGHFEQARRLLAEADDMTARLNIVQTRGTLHILGAELSLEEGKPADAFEHVERALALAVGTGDETLRPRMFALGIRALADRLEEALALGERVDAGKLRLLAAGLAQDAERIGAAQATRGVRTTHEGAALAASCAAERSRLDASDPDLWAAAALAWEHAGEPYPMAYALFREAEALLAGRGQRRRADERAQRAWGIAVELGAQPLRERVERLARRARISLHQVGGGGEVGASNVGADLGLTPRELEVLGQLSAGHTDAEIAAALFISKKTASVHVSNLLRKLDVGNRREAGRIGQVHGLG
jgi:DNA-binding CsgD family transcriptional regulator/tetratricopeptide (TPR) repeat protein